MPRCRADEALGLRPEDIRKARCAALLHDIGHGPFSHVSEHVLERYADRGKIPTESKREKIHEIITARMVRDDKDIARILGQHSCNEIAELLGGSGGSRALRSLVSGPLDSDKQDYLLRDSYFCGVPYGAFDIHQLHRSLTLVDNGEGAELMIRPNALHSLEQYVLGKYYLTTNVYRHKVLLITDQMIVRAIVLGIEKDGDDRLRRLYTYDGSPGFVGRFEAWDDARFFHEFLPKGRSRSRCGAMLERLRSRHLLKRVFSRSLRDFPKQVRDEVSRLSATGNEARRTRVESGAAEVLGSVTREQVDPDFVIVHAFDIRSVRETSRNDEKGILIDARPVPRAFIDESTLFRSINEGLHDNFVEIYAPVSWTDAAERDRICRDAQEPLQRLIEDCCTVAKRSKKR